MMNLRFRTLVTIASVTGLVLLSNCGKNSAPDQNGGDQGGQNGSNAVPAPKVYRWVKVDSPEEKALAYSEHLTMTGDYPRALYLLETIGEKYQDLTPTPALAESLERLRAIQAKDAELAPTLGSLKANNADVLASLNEAGKDGLVVLRRHLLENKDPDLSVAIAKHLVDVDDAKGGLAIYTLMKQGKTKAEQVQRLAPLLKEMIKKHANTPPYDTAFLEGLLMNIAIESSAEKASALRGVLAAWNFKGLPPGTLDTYADAIANDRPYEKIHLMELMTVLYTHHSNRSDSAFDNFFSKPRYTDCSNYLLRAAGDERNCIKREVEALGKAFGLPDQEALENELALYYKLNEPTNTIYVTDARSRAIRTKLLGNIAARAVVKGLEGNGLNFKGNAILRLSKRSPLMHEKENRDGKMKKAYRELNVLMNGDYSFSVWVNPTKIPTARESKEDTLSVICRELSPIGLNLLRSGGFCMIHPCDGKPSIARTSVPVPVGRWTHLAAVVSRARGTVQIFMNGKEVGKSNFQPNTPVESTYIRMSHFLVGGTTDQRSMEWGNNRNDTRPAAPKYLNHAYVGKVDEIRLYFRALSGKEIKQLYDIHAGLAR